MYMDPYTSLIGSLLKSWQTGERLTRLAIFLALVNLFLAVVTISLSKLEIIEKSIADFIAPVLFGIAGTLIMGVIAYQNLLEQQAKQEEIASVQERVLEYPEKPQFAWDLARTKLENYLDRNLAQVRSIYWLTLFVMICGFGFIMYGLYYAFQSPERLPVSIVASASGVLISFIGGSLLLIYRSVLAQSKGYVVVLERINAVGMAVQVIASIPDSGSDLKNQTTADLARQLLTLYAARPTSDIEVAKGGN